MQLHVGRCWSFWNVLDQSGILLRASRSETPPRSWSLLVMAATVARRTASSAVVGQAARGPLADLADRTSVCRRSIGGRAAMPFPSASFDALVKGLVPVVLVARLADQAVAIPNAIVEALSPAPLVARLAIEIPRGDLP